MSSNLSNAVRAYRERGFGGVLRAVVRRLKLPATSKSRWRKGIGSEAEFWDSYFRTRGLEWPDDYRERLDPDRPLQPRPAALLPAGTDLRVLDVGAGPLTYLGKKVEGRQISITAVDPLADTYDELLAKYDVRPVVRTTKLEAEHLDRQFAPGTFDLVFARNCIDHSFDPERAILNMVGVVKDHCYVLLEHRPNEAETNKYTGLHQWNFSTSQAGEFIIRGRDSSVNITEKYAGSFRATCEMVTDPQEEGEWLITRILKAPAPKH